MGLLLVQQGLLKGLERKDALLPRLSDDEKAEIL